MENSLPRRRRPRRRSTGIFSFWNVAPVIAMFGGITLVWPAVGSSSTRDGIGQVMGISMVFPGADYAEAPLDLDEEADESHQHASIADVLDPGVLAAGSASDSQSLVATANWSSHRVWSDFALGDDDEDESWADDLLAEDGDLQSAELWAAGVDIPSSLFATPETGFAAPRLAGPSQARPAPFIFGGAAAPPAGPNYWNAQRSISPVGVSPYPIYPGPNAGVYPPVLSPNNVVAASAGTGMLSAASTNSAISAAPASLPSQPSLGSAIGQSVTQPNQGDRGDRGERGERDNRDRSGPRQATSAQSSGSSGRGDRSQ